MWTPPRAAQYLGRGPRSLGEWILRDVAGNEFSAAEYQRAYAVLRMLGATGLAETLRSALATRRPVAPELQTKLHESYRLGPGNRPVKMAGGPL